MGFVSNLRGDIEDSRGVETSDRQSAPPGFDLERVRWAGMTGHSCLVEQDKTNWSSDPNEGEASLAYGSQIRD